jgi:hypothetical protein
MDEGRKFVADMAKKIKSDVDSGFMVSGRRHTRSSAKPSMVQKGQRRT